MGIEFLSCKMKRVLEMDGDEDCTTIKIVLIINELHILKSLRW